MDIVTGAINGALGAVANPVVVIGVVMGAQMVGKAIPDSKRGPLGVVRKLAKVVSLYVPNKA